MELFFHIDKTFYDIASFDDICYLKYYKYNRTTKSCQNQFAYLRTRIENST